MSLDDYLMRAIAEHRTAWADTAARALMAVGTTTAGVLVLAAALLALVVVRRGYRTASAVVLALVVAGVVAGTLKAVIDRPRPPFALALVPLGGSSMPSTHAAFTSAAAAALLVAARWTSDRTRRLAGVLLAVATVVVGVALVYIGSHWPTDVLAGWAIGVPIGAAAALLLRRNPPPALPVSKA